MKSKLLTSLLLCIAILGFSQEYQLSESAKISVITIGPGANLNDAFGHNAFRVYDPKAKLDVVYGYGGYDFDTPNFYLKFAQGKLNYLVTQHSFRQFYNTYVYFNRTIREQVLDLNQVQKQELYDALVENYKPENREYLYDFFYDNCATRIRDLSQSSIQGGIAFSNPDNFEQKTFRDLIYDHVNKNTWGSLGIDVALGSVVDKEAKPMEYMFLPEYIHQFFEKARFNNTHPLVSTQQVLYQGNDKKYSEGVIYSPLVVLGLIGLILLWITYRDYKRQKRSKWLDTLIFSITGLTGVLLLLLWFATDHTGTVMNYNLLWAFPLNLLLVFQLNKKEVKLWVRKFIKFLVIMLALLTFHWIMAIQVFAIGLIPILMALLMRYLFLIRILKK